MNEGNCDADNNPLLSFIYRENRACYEIASPNKREEHPEAKKKNERASANNRN